jgi:5-methylcytosine-specific restriction endonuclease McrA
MCKTIGTTKELAARLNITTEGVRQKVYRGQITKSVVFNEAGVIKGFYLDEAVAEVEAALELGRSKRKLRTEQQCVVCGTEFIPSNMTQKCCSIACGALNRKKYTAEQRADAIKANQKKQTEKAKAKRLEEKENTVLVCNYCNKEYSAADRNKADTKFCSKECQTKEHNRSRIERDKRAKFFILNRDGFKCIYCNSTSIEDGVRLTIDHIKPLAKGGNNNVANLVTACKECNTSKNTTELSSDMFSRVSEIVIKRNQTLSDYDKQFIEKVWDGIATKRAK